MALEFMVIPSIGRRKKRNIILKLTLKYLARRSFKSKEECVKSLAAHLQLIKR